MSRWKSGMTGFPHPPMRLRADEAEEQTQGAVAEPHESRCELLQHCQAAGLQCQRLAEEERQTGARKPASISLLLLFFVFIHLCVASLLNCYQLGLQKCCSSDWAWRCPNGRERSFLEVPDWSNPRQTGCQYCSQTTWKFFPNWKYFWMFLAYSYFCSHKFSTDVGGEILGWCRWRLEHLSHSDYNVVLKLPEENRFFKILAVFLYFFFSCMGLWKYSVYKGYRRFPSRHLFLQQQYMT